MKLYHFLILLTVSIFFLGCPTGGNNEVPKLCDESQARERTDECWIRDFNLNGSAFPNPLSRNGTLNINTTFGAASVAMQFLNTTISVRVWNATGQLVSNQAVGVFPPNSAVQTIPVWSPNGVAAGTYSLEVTFEFGVCGSEIVCINKIIVA